MLTDILLPDPSCLKYDSWSIEEGVLSIGVSTTNSSACCPDCNMVSHRVHSYYARKPADLPWASIPVRLKLRVRRFYCNNQACQRRTFVERLPSVVAPYARRTNRLASDQEYVAFAVGGKAGSRLLSRLRMPVSRETVLRLIRRSPDWVVWTPKVVGVDDWALCKGQVYGTILVDLERHKPVDLLPDRSAESLAKWFQEHPGVEVISRDRGAEYIKGATLGAPDAIQVADRWHLLKNLSEAIERLLVKEPAWLQAAVETSDEPSREHDNAPVPLETGVPSQSTKAQEDQRARRVIRQARFDRVKALQEQGVSNREIGRQLDLSYHTVARYLAADTCPTYAKRRKRPSKLDPYRNYLQMQWDAGRRNASQLWREIRVQGYSGSRGLVAIWAATMRTSLPKVTSDSARPRVRHIPPLSPRQAVWLFMKPPQELSCEQTGALMRMSTSDPKVAIVHDLVQTFIEMFKKRQPTTLLPWLKAASESGFKALGNFADGLRKDINAVMASLLLTWSNGQVEGQVNRLKFIKRQMYGRANFDLLRRRVLGQQDAVVL